MDYHVAKTFNRLGVRYRPGDAPPPDLDLVTTAHYLRHGMLAEAATAAKPATRTRRTPAPQQASTPTPTEGQGPAPTQGQPAAPDNTTTAPAADPADAA